MKEKNLERLYKLLERADREKDMETAAAIRRSICVTLPPDPVRSCTRIY